MRKSVYAIIVICLMTLLTGCAGTGGWTMPWDEPWNMPWNASQDARTDLVEMLLGVRTMSQGDLETLCGEMTLLQGCATYIWVFLEGEPSENTFLFKVQYVSNYSTLNVECGAAEPCFKDNILYTMEYNSEHRMGQIGDLLNKEFNLGLSYNKRVTFAQLFMGILAS